MTGFSAYYQLAHVTDRSEAPSVTSFERGEMWLFDDLDVSLFPQQMVGKFRWTLPVTSSSKLIRKDLCEDLWDRIMCHVFSVCYLGCVKKKTASKMEIWSIPISADLVHLFFKMVCRLRSYGLDGCCSIKLSWIKLFWARFKKTCSPADCRRRWFNGSMMHLYKFNTRYFAPIWCDLNLNPSQTCRKALEKVYVFSNFLRSRWYWYCIGHYWLPSSLPL